ncbi:amino acid adenylation domain-containing protein [Flavobacterium sp. LHD-85]|uniref:amino acid adenylation domain-containing protein n=1 Tax=Flavobacterium sp. LHD-85 TaxID=3071410 RepID=UPI0027DF79B0|nr:amino acid adenylation domain-containing protein [Flavobacterium sp. LHD-85]MDQ6531223.1 amino acid adenylation domain-containing protein [Flavobacterium sp. LHD-85]
MKFTLPQQDIYFDQLLHPNEPIYNIGAKIEIKGQIDVEILNKAYIELINQHDAYRITLVKNQENVTAKIVETNTSRLGFVDFSKDENAYNKATSYMQKEFMKPFDLFDKNLLHIFTIVKVTDDFHYLFSVYHHIITDGWGTSLMFQRLVQNYNEIFEFGEVKTLYPFSYQCFVEDDEMYQNSESFLEDKKYWVQKFKSLPENIFDKINDAIKINKSSRKELIIKREVYNQLNKLASEYKCSTFNLILAFLYIYFGRKHENNDFAIGLPVLNRSKSKYKKTVGLFMGISPLRIALDFEASIEDLIIAIKNQLRHDYRHQRFSLGKLIQELQIFNEKERLFNITLSYEKQNYATNFQNTQTKVIPLSHQAERVALAIYIREFDDLEDVKVDFDYNLNYFDDLRITDVVNHFENLINSILTSPDKKLKELEFLTKDEERQLIKEFNNTQADYPRDKTVIDLFELQVLTTPEKIAIKDDYRSFSYSELNQLSNKIAEYIIATFGEEDKSPIAVLLSRSANLVAILLGIFKAGRSYIPLDPNFPKERLCYIVDNSQSKVLINENGYDLAEVGDVEILSLENILEAIHAFDGNRSSIISSKETAYIIYTSGSTGNPKGVEIAHQSLLNFLISIQQKPGVSLNDILFSVTTYSFDISILEFFTPLISGATLYIASQDILSDPNFTIQKIEKIRPTLIQATPSFYQMLFNADWQGNKELKVLCGGDLLSEALAEKLINNSLEVWNMYGPTETTIWSSIKKIECPEDASNIGKPINNTQFYLLDSFLNLKPIGTSGAIYIAGDGLARGYYKNEKLTQEKFIKNPFDNTSLLYETGDVGKWNDDGEIEFLGRNDNQVKIRGYRIELGDIEAQLNQIIGIKGSVVIAKKENQYEAFLVAYILKSDEVEKERIFEILKSNLPYYMIPNAIIFLDEFPLTPNQKIDRKSLSQRSIQQNKDYNAFKAPVSELENKLSDFWAIVLNSTNPISVNDNFFALGGHSLNAVKLMGLIAKNLSFNITIKNIFDYPTIELLARYIQTLRPGKSINLTISEPKDFYNVTPSQYNIWVTSQQKHSSIAYNMSAGYAIEGSINVDKIAESINKIIDEHEILRTNFIEIDGKPYQKVNSYNNIKIEISTDKLKSTDVNDTVNQLLNKEFDLEHDLLMRVHLIELATSQFILLFSTHHIIMDGLSLEILTKKIIKYYNENTSQVGIKENNLEFQFKDYSEWYNKTVQENIEKNAFFWKNYLENYQPKDSFRRDFNIGSKSQNGNKLMFEITPEITFGLKELALKEQVTFYTLLAATLNVLIYKISNHSDISIATVDSGRNISELNNQIGMFVKTIVLRTHIDSNQSFAAILGNIQSNLLEINEYQDFPFEKFSQSFFDLLLVYQNPDFSFDTIDTFDGLKLTSYPVENKYSRMPIVFNLFENNNKLTGIIDYNCDLFEASTIQIIALKYCKILNSLLENPSLSLDLVDDKLEFEKNAVLDFDFNF